MNLLSVSLRNVHVRRLSSLLTTASVALGAALVAGLWLMIDQTEQRYQASYKGYDAIIGPKEGSPLALVLSTVMNLGYQPGVVPMSVYQELRDGALAKRYHTRYAIPQARGDYYEGFPIVGTTDEWFTKFARGRDESGAPRLLEFAAGRHWQFGHDEFVAFAEHLAEDARHAAEEHHEGDHGHDHEHEIPDGWKAAVVGSAVAAKLGLQIGSKIVPAHGEDGDVAHHHDEAACEVVGVLAPTRSPIDRCVYVPLGLFLSIAGHEAIRPDTQELEAGNVLLSAVVFDGAHPLAGAWLRRDFQTRSDAQVAWPQTEIPQLLAMVGNAADILRIVAWLVVVVASIGVCVALYNTMNERRREIAIMRALGARRWQILTIILLEATFVSFVGAVLGVVLCHASALLFADAIADRTSVVVDWASFTKDEIWLILGITGLGAFAGVSPAIKGSMTEVADNIGPVS